MEFCCAEPGDPGLVIEQYALLCALRVRPLMLCLCFISPFTKEEASANSHLHTSLLAALSYELKYLSIHLWKYTTHTHTHTQSCRKKKQICLIVSVQPFLLTVKRKNKKTYVKAYGDLHVKEDKAQAPVQLLALKCL